MRCHRYFKWHTRVVTFEPAVEAPKRAAFEREQQADDDQLTRPELGLRMLVPAREPIIYQAEELDDKIFGGHSAHPRQSSGQTQSEGRLWPFCQLAPVVS